MIAKYYTRRQTYWVFWAQIPIAQPSVYPENIVWFISNRNRVISPWQMRSLRPWRFHSLWNVAVRHFAKVILVNAWS